MEAHGSTGSVCGPLLCMHLGYRRTGVAEQGAEFWVLVGWRQCPAGREPSAASRETGTSLLLRCRGRWPSRSCFCGALPFGACVPADPG